MRKKPYYIHSICRADMRISNVNKQPTEPRFSGLQLCPSVEVTQLETKRVHAD